MPIPTNKNEHSFALNLEREKSQFSYFLYKRDLEGICISFTLHAGLLETWNGNIIT